MRVVYAGPGPLEKDFAMKATSLLAGTLFSIFSFAPLYGGEAGPTLDVWPGAAPGEAGTIPEEKLEQSKPGEKPYKKITNVSKPTLTVYRPDKEKDTGISVIIAPGGGYKVLMMDYEGEDVATWLNGLGITGIVLKYRIPGREGQPRYQAALLDAQRAVSLVRSKAKEWNLDPNKVGMLGFSAGGHLTGAASTNFEKRLYETKDDVDQVSCRPDFSILIYPGGMLEKDKPALSSEITVTEKTPPTFMVMSHDDRVNSENCIYYYLALKKANVPAEMHIYATGGHGYGMRAGDKPFNKWTTRCEEWMKVQGILK